MLRITCCHSSLMSSAPRRAARGSSASASSSDVGPASAMISVSCSWWSLTAWQYFSCSVAHPASGGQEQQQGRQRGRRSVAGHAVSPARSSCAAQDAVPERLRVGSREQQSRARSSASTRPRTAEDPSESATVPPWAPYPGASSGPLMSNDSPVSPMVAPTTAPNEPSGSAPSLRRRSRSRTVPATVRRRRWWRAGPRGPPCWR